MKISYECLSWRPTKLASTEQVKVQMKDGLPGIWAVVRYDTVASLIQTQLMGQFRGNREDAGKQGTIFGCQVCQGVDVTPGNEQDMGGCLRVDVCECDDILVLIDDFTRYLTRCYSAEKTMIHTLPFRLCMDGFEAWYTTPRNRPYTSYYFSIASSPSLATVATFSSGVSMVVPIVPVVPVVSVVSVGTTTASGVSTAVSVVATASADVSVAVSVVATVCSAVSTTVSATTGASDSGFSPSCVCPCLSSPGFFSTSPCKAGSLNWGKPISWRMALIAW